ncbi:MAG: PIG-L deacetylase family protein [Ginsengibacter sp.]
MKRKDFLHKGLLSSALVGSSLFTLGLDGNKSTPEKLVKEDPNGIVGDPEEIVIERHVTGKPHKGKVLLAIQAHSDDIPLFAGGTVAKLLDEGYTGYLLRTSDDSSGDVEGNKKDNEKIARYYGMGKAYDFMYPHHRMDSIQIQDLKGRLIFLFRLLKVDTVITWDPWEHYEENPDHIATAHAVEAARWMAGMATDYPEHLDAGLKPHSPKERYYFSRDPQRVNRIVDISNYIDKKVEVNMLNTTKGPAGQGAGRKLKEKLAKEGKKLAILGDDDSKADFNYVKHFVFDIDARRLNFTQISNRELGKQYGLEWAERFHYIKDLASNDLEANKLQQYINKNAVPK